MRIGAYRSGAPKQQRFQLIPLSGQQYRMVGRVAETADDRVFRNGAGEAE
jgi:hypothetical protein